MNITGTQPVGTDHAADVPGPPPLSRGFAVALAVAGILFVLYPAIRPFADETTLQGAAAFASSPWVVAHTMGMAAFVLMALGLLGLHSRWQHTPAVSGSLAALVASWTGVSLTLAFYGAETFGLAVIGQEAHDRGDPSLMALADAVRLGPGIAFLAAGLVLVAAGAVMLAVAIWRAGDRPRWSGVPLAVGLALYLPQFMAPQPFRVAHGVLMLIGCLLVARTLDTPAAGADQWFSGDVWPRTDHGRGSWNRVSWAKQAPVGTRPPRGVVPRVDPRGVHMSTTLHRPPRDLEVTSERPSTPYRLLRALFWNDDQKRARTPWLILIPVVGAFATMTIVEVALADSGLALAVQHALWNAAALLTVITLIGVSRRYLGARSLADYGLRFDRGWRADLRAGLVIGIVGVTIPFAIGIGLGWIEVAEVFARGDLALLSGIAVAVFAFIWVGVWEELAMRGVFLCNAADGLRRWLSPHRAIAGAIGLSGLVFGVGHLAHTGVSPLLLTWVFAGMVFGIVYVLSGSLALPIGIHITFNIAYNAIFARTDVAGGEYYSAITRVDVDSNLAFLQYGGLIDVAAFTSVLLLTVVWLWRSRGAVSIDLDALRLEPRLESSKPAATMAIPQPAAGTIGRSNRG